MNHPSIEKLGTITCDLVETTPLVYRDRLYRFEYVRYKHYQPNTTGDSYFRFVDVETGRYTPGFAQGFHLGCAHAEGDWLYAYGVSAWGASELHVFWSDDMERWASQPAIRQPGWGLYNSSVCRGPDRYIMAFEVGRPPDVVGVPFTNFFAESDDLINWKMMSLDHVFDRSRYTACPTIRYCDGYYYVLYLEACRTAPDAPPSYETHITRTRNFKNWEPPKPVMCASEEDRRVLDPALSPEHRERLRTAVNINNSDVDLCEFKGEVAICYSWGDQHGVEHLAAARYAGSLERFLKGYFSD